MKKVSIDNNSLAHTSWNCKYHIVFAPKYRRKVFFAEKRFLVSIPPKMSVSGFMGYIKGKSALLVFQKYGNMKFAYRNREFW